MTTITLPVLADGERYAGLILNAEGTPTHHLILLPGSIKANWNDAMKFAADLGGELPTRQEQALLYANCKDGFDPAWYWSSETHASYSGYAWVQHFRSGTQISVHKGFAYRARAVRRSVI